MRPKRMILLVGPNEQILSVRSFLLETRGYDVARFESAAEALTWLANQLPGAVSLLLTELLMVEMDGNELVRRAKHLDPYLPAMIVSDTVTSYDRANHADAFLPKGACSVAELLERIRVLVIRKRGPRPAIVEPEPEKKPVGRALPLFGSKSKRRPAA